MAKPNLGGRTLMIYDCPEHGHRDDGRQEAWTKSGKRLTVCTICSENEWRDGKRTKAPWLRCRKVQWTDRGAKATTCGAKCMGAKGPACDCRCGGEMHGSGGQTNPKKPAEKLVMWGFHPAHGGAPMRLSDWTNAEARRREKDGWTVAAYAKGDAPTGLALQASERAARANPRRRTRRNPALMLVTANPPSGAVERVREAWATFHHHPFDGQVKRLPAIPGGPACVFALGECVAMDFGSGDARPSGRRPLVVCDPSDDSIWIVAQGGAMDLRKCAGRTLRAITYAPVAASGKEDVDWRHQFESPRPRLKVMGSAGRCRAALLDGGGYEVRDWLYH